MTNKKTDPQLIEDIKDELCEDLSRYDNDFKTWSGALPLSCPSNTLEGLLDKVHEDEVDDLIYQVLVPFIDSLEKTQGK